MWFVGVSRVWIIGLDRHRSRRFLGDDRRWISTVPLLAWFAGRMDVRWELSGVLNG